MRHLIRALFRLLVGTSSFVAVFVPTMLLAIWAGFYLWNTVVFLAAPGVPIEVEYEAENGIARLRALSYAISYDADARAVRVLLYGTSIVNANGETVARLKRLDASIEFSPQRVHVLASDGKAHLDRLGDGSFSYSSMLPKQHTEGEDTSVDVVAKNIAITYRDMTQAPVLTEFAVIRTLRAHALGSTMHGFADVSTARYGEMPLELTAIKDGPLLIEGKANNLETRRAWEHVIRWVDPKTVRDWGRLDAASIKATGKFWVRVFKGKVTSSADLVVHAREMTIGDLVSKGDVHGNILISERGLVGNLDVLEQSRSAGFNGSIDWSGPIRLGGHLVAKTTSGQALWKPLRAILPKGFVLGGASFEGNIALTKAGWNVVGKARTAHVAYNEERISNGVWTVGLDPNRVVTKLETGQWDGRHVSGIASLLFKSGKLDGALRLENGSLASLAKRFGQKNISGSVSAQVVLSGTRDKPRMEVATVGGATYKANDGRSIVLGLFNGRFTVDNKGATVKRFILSGPNGAASAHGTYAFKDQAMNLQLDAGSIDLPVINPEVEGVGFGKLSIKGTVKKPLVAGKVEAYGIQYQDYSLPIARSQISWKNDQLFATNIDLETGNTSATGDAQWNSKTDAIKGNFMASTLTLSDWFGERVNGAAKSDNLVLSGTLAEPVLVGDFHSEGTAFDAITLDRIDARVRVDRHEAQLLQATIGYDKSEGIVAGKLVFDTRAFNVHGNFIDLDLKKLAQNNADYDLEGLANGEFSAAGTLDTLKDVNARLELRDVAVNGAPLGGGIWTLNGVNNDFNFEGGLGIFGRALRITDGHYNSLDNKIGAVANVFNFDLQALLQATSKWTTELPESVRQDLSRTEGQLFARMVLSGTTDQPNFAIADLGVANFSVNGRDAGKIMLQGTKTGDEWRLDALDWTLRQATETKAASRLVASGTAIDGDEINAGGELTNFDLSWIPTVVRDLFPIAGDIEQFSFLVKGKTENPEVSGSLQAKQVGFTQEDGTLQMFPIQVLMDEITFKNKQITASGSFAYEGFSGPITIDGPLSAFYANRAPTGKSNPFIVNFDLKERDLKDLTELFPDIDPANTTGTVRGSAHMSVDQGVVKIDGSLSARSDQVALKGLEETFRSLILDVTANDQSVSVNGSFSPSDGGDVRLELASDLTALLRQGIGFQESFDSAKINGSFTAQSVQIDQRLQNSKRDYEGRIVGMLDGALAITGPLRRPVIRNQDPLKPITFSSGFIELPSDFPVSTTSGTPYIDPVFEGITLATTVGTRLKTSLVNMFLGGGGQLNGSLTEPNLTGTLNVSGGTLQLPTARVNLEEGGRIGILYSVQPNGSSLARVDLNLEGRTSVSARRFDSIERYDVALQVRGDLLDPRNTLTFTAQSDPPDLSQDQILALLGQKEFIEGLADSVFRRRGAVESAVLGFTLQTWLTPFTRTLANSLKLDYLAFEYNPLDGFSASAAKTLGKGWTLSFRRQITSTVGRPNDYELKLSYRPPIRGRFFERTRFGIATDNRRPWKLTFEYGIRF